ncbi:MAG: hypothetical protein WAV27_00025 [Xanthobacteraceae bacterium]
MADRAKAPNAMFQKDEVLKGLHIRLVAAGSPTFWRSIFSAVPLFVSLLIWNPAAASAVTPTCVVKLKVSSNEGSDGGTKAFVTKVLTGQGYKIIDDWLFTMWRASDYDVQIVMTYTLVQNYGFPVTLMQMQLFIADSTGKILVDSDIDRANLEDNLRNSIPACNTAQ